MNETLCLFDGELGDDDFRALLAAFKPGVQIGVLLDSCHSGGVDRALDDRRARRMPPTIVKKLAVSSGRRTAMPWLKSRDRDVRAGVVILTACREQETAADGERNGAFTECLLASWQKPFWKTLARYSWADWFQSTARLCAQLHPQQHPCARLLGNHIWHKAAL